MPQKTIEIDGLPFTQIYIFGSYLPSITSIEYVLSKYNDKRNKRNFCDASNFIVRNVSKMYSLPSEPFDRARYEVLFKNIDWDNISIPDLNASKFKVMESQCELVGYSFYQLVQSDFVEGWFDTVLSSFVTDRRESNRATNALLRIIRDENITNFDEKIAKQKVRIKPTCPNPEIVRCQEYNDASTYLQEFESRRIAVTEKLYINTSRANYIKFSIMKNDFVRELELQKISYKFVKEHKGKKTIFSCQRCHVQSLVKQMPKSKTCDSCQDKLTKEKKASRKIDRSGWKFARLGICKGGCGSTKIKINTFGSCLKCYSPSL